MHNVCCVRIDFCACNEYFWNELSIFCLFLLSPSICDSHNSHHIRTASRFNLFTWIGFQPTRLAVLFRCAYCNMIYDHDGLSTKTADCNPNIVFWRKTFFIFLYSQHPAGIWIVLLFSSPKLRYYFICGSARLHAQEMCNFNCLKPTNINSWAQNRQQCRCVNCALSCRMD